MRLIHDMSWTRRGSSLLWGAEALSAVAGPAEVVSIRQFFALAQAWPDNLPSGKGNTLVVAGLEGCVDVLSPEDAEAWLEQDLRPRMLSFQEEYQGQAALVLWLPTGRQRMHMLRATETYLWHCGPPTNRKLALGHILWGGAEADVGRILDAHEKNQDVDGPAWVGLYHPRIS
ncbi:MAG: hypothetical protein ACRERD_18490 [Candidatus Binatia bacterium]